MGLSYYGVKSCGGVMTGEKWESILDYHNRMRLLIAHGREKNHTGKLPAAQNMYELSWDCDLEKKAEEIAKDEDFDLESISPRVANIAHKAHCKEHEVEYHFFFRKLMERWRNEVREYGQTDPKNLYSDDSIEHWANMAYHKNTRIGCSYHRKGQAATFVCVYDKGPQWDEPIYEIGKKCKRNEDCTTYKDSKCDMLCVAPKQVMNFNKKYRNR
ncbi:hypothetical protein Y032_0097g2962 [Ancylostoma ceylanicum]|nr:hypothetical protein Y032_0097g2962 [Ancylostoma ceylanicum]